ncbi:MAG TPA: STAS domain-containing protein [Actinomycetes bacterium]|nr:STAS domain-containing protein [Actinomycetes bacterium]
MTAYEVAVQGQPPVAVMTLTGQVDRDAMGSLTAAYEDAVRSDPRVVLLDFSKVDYINSTGIALIVGILGRARAENRRVFASGLSSHYEHIFSITRLSDFIQIYSDVDAAVDGAAHS